MYGLPEDDPTGIETCRSFESFNVTQVSKYLYKISELLKISHYQCTG